MRYIEYQEKRNHGSSDFPFAIYHVNHLHPRYIMTYHWHKETEIIRVLSGELAITLNETRYVLHAGECLFISSGTLHGGIPKSCVYECLVFNMETAIKNIHMGKTDMEYILKSEYSIQSYYSAEEKVVLDEINTMFDAICSKEPGYSLIVQGSLYVLLGTILRSNYYTKQDILPVYAKRKIRQYKTVLAFIADHYSEPLTLDDLAGCVHMNSRYFCRFFKELTQQSPIDYLNSYRIEAACEKISTTDKSITEIAFDCGFNDASYFVKVFKKYKKTTPSQYLHNELENPGSQSEPL